MTHVKMAKITFSLVIIYLVGGLILAVIYGITSPIKFQKEKAEKEAALLTMMPEADKIEKLGDWEPHEKHAEYYAALKCTEVNVITEKDEKTGEMKEIKECIDPENMGYIVEGYGKGYSSYIHVLASVDKDFLVRKISILGHGETPGLGDEIEKDYFLNQFEAKNVDNLEVVKRETEDKIEAITGATISSRAVAEDGVKNGVKMLKERLSGEVEG
jgi:electron transport complex protein RnfG